MASEVPVVRWLAAFRQASDLSASVDWELKAERMVACEAVVYSKRRSRMPRHVRLGLLVDQSRSSIVRAYSCDVWSRPGQDGELVRSSKRYLRSRHGRFSVAHTWDDLGKLAKDVPWYGHTEVFVRDQAYIGLVVRPGSWKPTWQYAIQLSQETGLPIVDYDGNPVNARYMMMLAPNPPHRHVGRAPNVPSKWAYIRDDATSYLRALIARGWRVYAPTFGSTHALEDYEIELVSKRQARRLVGTVVDERRKRGKTRQLVVLRVESAVKAFGPGHEGYVALARWV